MKVEIVKPIRNTNLFRKNQKCWIWFKTGACAICVKGKYRGKGRMIQGWLHYPRDFDYNDIKEIEITETDAKKLQLIF